MIVPFRRPSFLSRFRRKAAAPAAPGAWRRRVRWLTCIVIGHAWRPLTERMRAIPLDGLRGGRRPAIGFFVTGRACARCDIRQTFAEAAELDRQRARALGASVDTGADAPGERR